MRFLIMLVTVLAGLYGGYWFIGRAALDRGGNSLIADLRADGWDVTYTDIATVGFPSRFDTTVTDFTITDPGTGIGLQMPYFQTFALSYRPNQIIANWLEDQAVTLPGQTITITSSMLSAGAGVAQALDLAFDYLTVSGDVLTFTSDQGWTASVQTALFAFRAAGPGPADYDIFASGDIIALPAWVLARIDPEGTMPATITSAVMDSGVTLDEPLNRHLSGQPALRSLSLRDMQLTWGTLKMTGAGALTIDAGGVPDGRITFNVQDWDRLIALAVAAGVLDAGLAPTIGNVAAALANGGDTVSLPLSFQDGFMSLGPLPLGPAPRFD